LAGGHIRAAYFDRGGEYLCVVAAPAAIGEPCIRLVGAFESGVAENIDHLIVGEVLGRGAGVAANYRQCVGTYTGHQHQFLAAFDLYLIADAESAAVIDNKVGIGARVGKRAVVDGIFVGQKLIFEPFVMCAGSFSKGVS
jgi:hypothetical protein